MIIIPYPNRLVRSRCEVEEVKVPIGKLSDSPGYAVGDTMLHSCCRRLPVGLDYFDALGELYRSAFGVPWGHGCQCRLVVGHAVSKDL